MQRVLLDSDVSLMEHALDLWVSTLRNQLKTMNISGKALQVIEENIESSERLLLRVREWERAVKK